jgi:hypothetical protein
MLADGRGSVTCAVAMGERTMPAVVLTVKAAYLDQYTNQMTESAPIKLNAMVDSFILESRAQKGWTK